MKHLYQLLLALLFVVMACNTTKMTKSHVERCRWDSMQLVDMFKEKYPHCSFDSASCSISKVECLKLEWIDKKHIEEFYEVTTFTEAYKLSLNQKHYLLLFGQPAGATGIGVDYKEYECYEYGHKEAILEFSSLHGSPCSVFYNIDNGQIGYWELSKEQRVNKDSTCTEIDDYDIKLSVYTNKKCIHSELLDKTIIK